MFIYFQWEFPSIQPVGTGHRFIYLLSKSTYEPPSQSYVIYICLPCSKPKVSLFAGEGGWLIASGNHGFVFLRMIEQQICVREGKRKGRGKEN
jgi:hypothetical protein